jgi:hypothetical protein
MSDALKAYRVDLKRQAERVTEAAYEPDLSYQKRSTTYSRTGAIFTDGSQSAPGTREAMPADFNPRDGQRVGVYRHIGVGLPPGGHATITDCRGKDVSLTHYASGKPIQWRVNPDIADRQAQQIVQTAADVIEVKNMYAHIRRVVRDGVQRDRLHSHGLSYVPGSASYAAQRDYLSELKVTLTHYQQRLKAQRSAGARSGLIERIERGIAKLETIIDRQTEKLADLEADHIAAQEADTGDNGTSGDDTPAVQQNGTQGGTEAATIDNEQLAEAIA